MSVFNSERHCLKGAKNSRIYTNEQAIMLKSMYA